MRGVTFKRLVVFTVCLQMVSMLAVDAHFALIPHMLTGHGAECLHAHGEDHGELPERDALSTEEGQRGSHAADSCTVTVLSEAQLHCLVDAGCPVWLEPCSLEQSALRAQQTPSLEACVDFAPKRSPPLLSA